jgi:hypothetical protein
MKRIDRNKYEGSLEEEPASTQVPALMLVISLLE